MHRYELLVLKALKASNGIGLEELADRSGLGKDEVMWALENLKDKGMVEVEYSSKSETELSAEGKQYHKDGLPEMQLVRKASEGKMDVSRLTDTQRIGLQWAKKNGWITVAGGEVRLTEAGRSALKKGLGVDELGRDELVKRRLGVVTERKAIVRIVATKQGIGAAQGSGEAEMVDSLDRSMISTGAWKNRGFKAYDIKVPVAAQLPAMRHPLKRLIEEVKDAYLGMGFQEISGPAVESSFWAFDSLFVPQDHPARDAQDTFYVSNVKGASLEGMEFVPMVRRAHQRGWHSKWDADTASQMLLRVHMTSVSARHIYNIVRSISSDPNAYDLPVKLFSVGRVFRNESIDYRHLADFYQHDGIIIGKNLTLSNLFDTLAKVYKHLGIKIRFKPSYFPFVEPAAEFLAYSESRDEWIEMGGSGVVREEITGVKRNKLTVLAWGIGLERTLLIRDPTMNSITELYGNSIGWLRNRKW